MTSSLSSSARPRCRATRRHRCFLLGSVVCWGNQWGIRSVWGKNLVVVLVLVLVVVVVLVLAVVVVVFLVVVVVP